MNTLQLGVIVDNRYVIGGVLGEGASGVVYRAKHSAMDRMVALKVLKQSIVPTEQSLAAFRNEVAVVKALQHPNVVQVFSIGLANSNCPYIAMEFLDGKRLSDLIAEQGCLDADIVIQLFLQACAGLQHAHDMGVVHRDVKPSNMVVTRSGNQPVLKIVDFGVARILGEDSQSATSTIVGSALYFSPEALSGVIDRRSDIYSLGCSMYEALCGNPPFSGATFFEVAHKHANQPVPAIVSVSGRDTVPENLKRVIHRMLAKNADQRYQSMNEVAEDLQRCLSGAPLTVPSKLAPAVERKWAGSTISKVRRHFVAVSLAMIALLSGLVAFKVFFLDKRSDPWRLQVRRLMAEADQAQLRGDFDAAKIALLKAIEVTCAADPNEAADLPDASSRLAVEAGVRQKYGTALRIHASTSGDSRELAEAIAELETSDRQIWTVIRSHIKKLKNDRADDVRIQQQANVIFEELIRVYLDGDQKEKAADHLDELLMSFDVVANYGGAELREMINFLDIGIQQLVKQHHLWRAKTFCKQRIRLQKIYAVSNATIVGDGKRYANLLRTTDGAGAAGQFMKNYLDDTVKSPQRLFDEYSRDVRRSSD